MSRIIVFCMLFCMLLTASPASAGCVGVGGANSWEILDSHSILVYDFRKPIVILKTPWCNIYNLSNICLTESLLCTGDKIFVDKQICEIRDLIPIDVNVNFVPDKIGTLTLYVKGYSEFSKGEFVGHYSPAGLLSVIAKDSYGLNFSSPDGTVDRLNEILRTPDFYDRVAQKGKKMKLHTHGERLIAGTREYRGRPYAELSDQERMDISHLNRLVLEAVYPDHCPKGYLKACP